LRSDDADAARLDAARQRFESSQRARDLALDAYLATYEYQPLPELPADVDSVTLHGIAPPPDTDVYLRYFVQDTVSFVVARAGDDLEYFDLPPRPIVSEAIDSALQALQHPGKMRGHRATAVAALSELIPWSFLSRHDAATRLVIVADDATQLVPFSVLAEHTSADGYVPLVESFQVVRTGSALQYYAATVAPDPGEAMVPHADIFVFADPLVGQPEYTGAAASPQVRGGERWVDRLPRLPATRLEAASIVRIYAGHSVEVHVGADATNDMLMSRPARAAQILHIATHGYYTETAPDIVGLATSGSDAAGAGRGGYLGFPELFSQPFYSKLVVVSGCNTMRGQDYNGWGVRSIADGFLAQGARSVIGTLWSVNDRPTALLMDAFYQALHDGDGDSALALASAQRKMIDSGTYVDPYYWGAVVLKSSEAALDQHVLTSH
jgi:CHAT domain-containing protein